MESPLDHLITNVQTQGKDCLLFNLEKQWGVKDIHSSAFNEELGIIVRAERMNRKSKSRTALIFFFPCKREETKR